MQTTLAQEETLSAQADLQPRARCAGCCRQIQCLLTFSNHVFVLESIFVRSFCGRVVVHPDFTVVAPIHRIGFPELREPKKSAPEAYVHGVCPVPLQYALPQSLLLCEQPNS